MVKQLSIFESEKLLRKYKIPHPKSYLTKSESEAISQAKKLGFPVVMKVHSENIIHKTDKGGVKINLLNEKDVEEAYSKLKKLSKEILIQKQIQGTFIFVGMKRDPTFGPVIAFGIGGIFIEILKDVSFKIAPVSKDEALDMIESIKSYSILQGARGQEKINIKNLIKIILQASKLAMGEKDIKEFDFNPIIINSKEAKAVDARFLK